MVDVAAIFDEVFGPGDQGQGLPEKKCVLRVSVSGHPKPLEGLDNSNTKTDDTKHIFEKRVSEQDLISKTDELALDAVVEIFEHFNWNNPPRDVLAEDQRKFRERRLH